ncbi:MFS transporter [Defluviitalea phaphyphila]|uniref:MFS transporter n=1 Tax=Defluviitalea phaphyphila TaxID=1473580 RepID=UPI0007311E65|nr:MFS transporter [Defluviitalea phaphyphila]
MNDRVQSVKIYKPNVISNMVLLLLGRLVSLFGSKIYSFAISLYVLKTTGSGTTFALSLVISTLPAVIFGPIAGVISDKIDRKRMVVLMDILSGIIILSLAGLAIINGLEITYIYISSFLLATCSTFFNVPFQSSIPNIVDEQNLMRTNSLNQAITSLTSIAGPFLGGMIYAFVDIQLFLVINGISFILSGISEIFIDFNLNKAETESSIDVVGNEEIIEKDREVIETKEEIENTELDKKQIIKNFINDFKDGFVYLKSIRSVFMMSMAGIFLNLFVALGLTIPFPYIVNEIIKMSEIQFGTLQAVFPLGMLVGAGILSVLPQSKKSFKKMIIGLFIIDIGTILLGLSIVLEQLIFTINTYFILYAIVGFIISVAIVFVNIPMEVNLQRIIPDNMRGRIFGLITTFSMSCIPIGMAISGLLIDLIPVWILPVISGIILLGLTIVMGFNKDIREL